MLLQAGFRKATSKTLSKPKVVRKLRHCRTCFQMCQESAVFKAQVLFQNFWLPSKQKEKSLKYTKKAPSTYIDLKSSNLTVGLLKFSVLIGCAASSHPKLSKEVFLMIQHFFISKGSKTPCTSRKPISVPAHHSKLTRVPASLTCLFLPFSIKSG